MSIEPNFHSTTLYNSRDSKYGRSGQLDANYKTEKAFSTSSLNPPKEKSPSRSTIESQYHNFFSSVMPLIQKFKQQNLSQQSLQKHRIKIISDESDEVWKKVRKQGYSYVELAGSRYNGLECEYHVLIGNFFLTISVLNLHRNCQQNINNTQYIGEGSFGAVKRLRAADKDIALKKIYFPPKKQTPFLHTNLINSDDFADSLEIRRAITEYSIYKICSVFKIGPQIIFQDYYDLVCFNDCIEFQMELCEPVDDKVNFSIYERDIKKCLGILHSLKIIHKDLKKQNTLYSPILKSYVLSDFGLTHSVKQNIWEKTETYFGGSPTHASPQMKQLLFNNQIGFVNLYINDIYCLQVTLDQLNRQSINSSQQYSKNSMSMGENYYEYYEVGLAEENGSSGSNSSNENTNQERSGSIQGSLSQSNFIPTESTCMTESQLSADKINYYQIKILYRYLQKKMNGEKHESKSTLQQLIEESIKSEADFEILRIQILRLLNPIINSLNDNLLKVTSLRNMIRMFGLQSEEVHKKLKYIAQNKSNILINNLQLQNYLIAASKTVYNNNLFRFKNHILNMERHMYFRNKRSLLTSLRTLLKNYFSRRDPTPEEKTQILILGIEVLNFQGLSEEQNSQIVAMLWRILQKRKVKLAEVDSKCVLELADKIYKEFQGRDKLFLRMNHNLIKIHLIYNSLESAQQYYKKVSQNRITLQNQLNSFLLSECQLDCQKELKISIINHILCQVSYSLLINENEKALEFSKAGYQKYTEFQVNDNIIKINILDNIVSTLTKLKKFDEAEVYNKELYESITKHCFPKKNCVQFALCYSYKGVINLDRNQFEEALQNFDLVLECTEDSLRGSNCVKLIKQTLVNISICYTKMKQPFKAVQFLEKALEFSLTYQCHQYEQSIQLIHNIMIWLIKLKNCDGKLAAYSNQLAGLKIRLMESKRINLSYEKQKLIPFFPFEVINQKRYKELLILAKKTVLTSVQPYLPRFQSWYIQTCSELANYYINQTKQTTKSLPFYWKIFKCIPKRERTEAIYKKMDFYVDLLIRANSSRRALKFLKEYTPFIPQQYQSIRAEAYKKLNQLSEELNTNDKQFFNLVWRNKSMRNQDYYKDTEDKINEFCSDNKIMKIWQKKLKCLKPECLQFKQDDTSSTSTQSTAEHLERPVNETERDTQKIIQQKIRAKRVKKNQI